MNICLLNFECTNIKNAQVKIVKPLHSSKQTEWPNHKVQTESQIPNCPQTVKDVKQVQGYSKLSKRRYGKITRSTKSGRKETNMQSKHVMQASSSKHHFPSVTLSEKYT